MRIVSLALLLSLLVPGCYFGRSPGAKSGAYVANGTAVVVGSAIAVGATQNHCEGDCTAGAAVSAVVVLAGIAIAGAGLIGIGVNAAVPTRHDEVAKPATGQVTLPGGKPATITLR